MNLFSFTGIVTSDPNFLDVNGVEIMQFHCSVEAGCGRKKLWVLIAVWKKKLIEDLEEIIERGVMVTCSGPIEGRDNSQDGPLLVRGTVVVPHVQEITEL